MKFLLINNENGSGGMKVYGKQLINSIYKNFGYCVIDTYNSDLKIDIETYNFILHFGWNQFNYGDFNNCDFSTLISKNTNKNILFVFFDVSFLNKSYIKEINKLYSFVIYDSYFSYIKGKKAGISLKNAIIQPGISEIKMNCLSKYDFLRDSKINFLHINNVGWLKGIDEIIESFLSAYKDNNKIRLILKINQKVYHYLEKNNYIKLIQEYLDSKDIYIINGETSQEDIWSLYSLSDCYINASKNETFSLPTLESLYLGLYIISPFETGMKEYLTEKEGVLRLKGNKGVVAKGRWLNNNESIGFVVDVNDLTKKIIKVSFYEKNKHLKKEFLLTKYNPNNLSNKLFELIGLNHLLS